MSLRLPPNVKLEIDIKEPDEDIEIAPLMFISLVENAFKHGVSPDLLSNITIQLQMIRENELECRVENSNFPKPESDNSGSGIGLSNLRKRLELAYPSAFELFFIDKGESYVSTLRIKI
jgi:LytS/YehU family sensor histidine kinase